MQRTDFWAPTAGTAAVSLVNRTSPRETDFEDVLAAKVSIDIAGHYNTPIFLHITLGRTLIYGALFTGPKSESAIENLKHDREGFGMTPLYLLR